MPVALLAVSSGSTHAILEPVRLNFFSSAPKLEEKWVAGGCETFCLLLQKRVGMKAILGIVVALPLLFASGGAAAQSKSQREADAHSKRQQQTRESTRQTSNRIVNDNSQRNYSNSQRSSSNKR